MVMGWDNDAVWMRWRPQEGTRLHLVTLDGSKVGGLHLRWMGGSRGPCLLSRVPVLTLQWCSA